MMIFMWRDVLTVPDNYSSGRLVAAWAMGGRVLDLPRQYQDDALYEISGLVSPPAALVAAQRQINGRNA